MTRILSVNPFDKLKPFVVKPIDDVAKIFPLIETPKIKMCSVKFFFRWEAELINRLITSKLFFKINVSKILRTNLQNSQQAQKT